MNETSGRDIIAGPLLATLFGGFAAEAAQAAGVDPTMTMITPPEKIHWKPLYNLPPGAARSATMFGKISDPGQYFVLIQ